jgi:uncharacterized membrane protein (UPF0182 family)
MDGRRARISRDVNGSNPANRNNLIGWIARRSDGENYGKAVVYDVPSTMEGENRIRVSPPCTTRSTISTSSYRRFRRA